MPDKTIRLDTSQPGQPVVAARPIPKAYRVAEGLRSLTMGALEATNPLAIAGQVAKQVYHAPVIRDVVEGVFGLTPGSLHEGPAAAAAAKPPKPLAPVVAQMKADGAAKRVDAGGLTAQERQLAMVNRVMRSPLTLSEAAAATGMMPAGPKPMTAKDVAVNTATRLTDAQYRAEMAAASKLTDPEDRYKLESSAYERAINRMIAAAGANPLNAANANLLPAMQDDGS